MDPKELFDDKNFIKEIPANETDAGKNGEHGGWYKGPLGWLYALKETDRYCTVLVKKSPEDDPAETLRFYRVLKEKDLIPIMREGLAYYINWYWNPANAGKDFVKTRNIYSNLAGYVRFMVSHEVGDAEWECLCGLYDAAVRAGGNAYILAETCKEMMKIRWMEPNQYILPELHEKLLLLPDFYYDFVVGMERNLAEREDLQKRVIRFMDRHPEITTSDVIIYTSFMNEDDALPDDAVEIIYSLVHENQHIFDMNMKAQADELVEERDKFQWRILTVYTHGLVYRIRQHYGICFMDYMDSAIGHSIINKKDEQTAEIVSINVADAFDYPGARQKLLTYSEQIIQNAGLSYIRLFCNKAEQKFYEEAGYLPDAEQSQEEIRWTDMVIMQKMMKTEIKKGLIFDMDGTLWDSAENVAKSWDLAVKQCGYSRDPITIQEMQGVMGKTMDKIAEILFPEVHGENLKALLAACCSVENDYLREHGGILYPDVRRTMEALRGRYHLYIVSNCQAGYIEAFLDYYRLWDLFEDIECYGNNGQPKAYNIRLLAERNALDFAAYVGDIQGDYDSSVEAGVSFIHAAYGFGTIDQPVPAIRSLRELPLIADQVL